MRPVALTGIKPLLLAAVLLFASTCAHAQQRGSGRPAPEPLRPPSPASCVLVSEHEQPVVFSVGRGSELGDQVHCASSGETVLRAELPPGQIAQAWLLVENNGTETIAITAVHTRAPGSSIQVDNNPTEIEPGASLRLEISLEIDPEVDFGTAFLHQINLALEGGNEDTFSLSLPVRLEAIDPDELFRQRFEVEPVLGQFL